MSSASNDSSSNAYRAVSSRDFNDSVGGPDVDARPDARSMHRLYLTIQGEIPMSQLVDLRSSRKIPPADHF